MNKADLQRPELDHLIRFEQEQLPYAKIVSTTGEGVDAFRARLWEIAPAEAAETPTILRDLVGPNETAVLVMPIDKEAPKGRIKQLQVQCVRDLLDGDSCCVVVKDAGLESALGQPEAPPKIVVTDAQVFERVARSTPDSVQLTAFSILLSRLKGDLVAQTRAAVAVETLRPGDRVLVAESCTHHPVEEDIGRVKIPRWLQQYVGGQAGVHDSARARLSRRPFAVQAGDSLRGLYVEPAGDAEPHRGVPSPGSADHQLWLGDRVFAGDSGARAGAVSRGARGLPRGARTSRRDWLRSDSLSAVSDYAAWSTNYDGNDQNRDSWLAQREPAISPGGAV